MKTATDAQKLTALTQLVGAAEQLIKRGGISKTWRLITSFKAKKTLRLVLGRTPKNDEVNRLVGVIKETKPANGKVTKIVAKPAPKAAKPAPKRAIRPARAVKPAAPKAKKTVIKKVTATAPTTPTPAPAMPAAVAS